MKMTALNRIKVFSPCALFLFLGLFLFPAFAQADVKFDEATSTFTGTGTYSAAVNSTSNLVVKPDSGGTITFTNNVVTTGQFKQINRNVVLDKDSVSTFGSFFITNDGDNGAKFTLNGKLTVVKFEVCNKNTSNIDINAGASLLATGEVYINQAKNAQGIINQKGGTVKFTTSGSTSVRIGHYPNTGYPSRYNLSGGTFDVPNTTTYVGWDGYGELNISGGTATLKGISLSNNSNGKGTLKLTGGTLNVGSDGVSRNKRGASSSATPVVTLGTATINATASHTWGNNMTATLSSGATTTFNADAGKTITVNTVLAGAGALTKTGAGSMILTAANTYTGATTVSGGTFRVTGADAAFASSSVTVQTGALFQTGADLAITDVILNGGAFAFGDTGNSTALTAKSVTLSSGTIHFDLNDSTVSDDYDKLQTGTISATSGVINLSFNFGDESVWWNAVGSDGIRLVSGSSVSDLSGVQVNVGGAATSSWALAARDNSICLVAAGSAPEAPKYWYANNTSDAAQETWTIDGESKLGVKLVAGTNTAVTFANPVSVTANGSFEVGETYNLTLSEAVSGSGSVTKTGAGTLTLAQAPAYTGNTAVESGTLALSAGGTLNDLSGAGTVSFGANALTLNNSSNTTFTGKLTGTGTVTKTGDGALTLTENISSAATITSNGGTLVFGTTGNTIDLGSKAVIKTNGGTIRVDGDLVVTTSYLSAAGTWTGDGSVTIQSGGQIRVGGTFDFAKGITLNGGLLFNDGDHGGKTATVPSAIYVTANSSLQSGWSGTLTLSGGLNGSGNLTINKDSGWTVVTGKGKYSGALTIIGNFRPGAANIGSAAAPADVSDYIGKGEITLKSASSTQGILQNNNNHITFPNNLNVAANSYLKSGWSKSMTFTGNLKGTGRLEILSDSGWVIMATKCTDNAFSGEVQTNWGSSSSMGQLRLGADQPFGANAGQANIYGNLDMNGYSQTFKGLNNDGDKGSIYNNTATLSTLTLNTTSKDLTFQSSIKGNIALVLKGDGKQTLSKAPEYTGTTTLESGTLVLAAGGTLYDFSGGETCVLDASGSTVTLNYTTDKAYSGVIEGTGSLAKTGTGTLTLSGANTYTGATTVSTGALKLTGEAVSANGPMTVESAGTLEYNVAEGTKKLTLDADKTITSAGQILKTGDGTFQINAPQGSFNASNLTVKAGRMDFQGVASGAVTTLEGAVFSPGNSVGEAKVGGEFTLDSNATLLLEQDASGMDVLRASSFNVASDAILDLEIGAVLPGSSYEIIQNTSSDFGEAQNASFWTSLLTPASANYWNLTVLGDTVYATLNANAVPEPSAWILLMLGAFGLLCWRKK